MSDDQPARHEETLPVPTTDLPGGSASLADGKWHRVHPATPFLQGGIVIIFIIGFVVANLRERIIEFFVPQSSDYNGEDTLDLMLANGLIGIALLVVLGVVVIVLTYSYISWRAQQFRVSDEYAEIKTGVLSRSHRRARLDRIQGVEIKRSFLARIFGVSKIDISVGASEGNVSLEFLRKTQADVLREDILTIASGMKRVKEQGVDREQAISDLTGKGMSGESVSANTVADRVNAFFNEEVDSAPANRESVVRIPFGRLIGSVLLTWPVVLTGLIVIGLVTQTILTGLGWGIFASIAFGISFVRIGWVTFSRSMRFSIVRVTDGIRISSGLTSTVSDVVPPGRIHGIEIGQPLLWKPFGWWQIRINKAGTSAADVVSGQSTLLPVGRLTDVRRVLSLVFDDQPNSGDMPPPDIDVILSSLEENADMAGFVVVPKRARWMLPISHRRTGYAIFLEWLMVRRGLFRRRLGIISFGRIQSVEVSQGPIERMFAVASVEVHLVPGQIQVVVPSIAVTDAKSLYEIVANRTVSAMENDHTQHWRTRT